MKVNSGDGDVQNKEVSDNQKQTCENDDLQDHSSKDFESQEGKAKQQNSEETEEHDEETQEGKEEAQGGEEQAKKQLPPRPRRVSIHFVLY